MNIGGRVPEEENDSKLRDLDTREIVLWAGPKAIVLIVECDFDGGEFFRGHRSSFAITWG